MAPNKRSRPDFSPPRSSKPIVVSAAVSGVREGVYKNQRNAAMSKQRAAISKKKAATPAKRPTTGVGRSVSGKGGNNMTDSRRRGRPAINDDDDDDEDDDCDTFNDGRSALALVDMQADEESDEDMDDEEESEEDEDEDTQLSNRRKRGQQQNSSPEPDMILAEITTTNEPSDTAIPAKLVHRLLAHHFERGEKTKISTDARDLVSRYLEVFVREAIMRSAFEKDDKQNGDGSGGAGGGFLEVEDLERAAVQLCLDF